MGELMNCQTYSSTLDGIRNYWRVDDLWELAANIPVEYVPIKHLTEQLNGTCWTEGEKDDVTPQWVLGHTRRILNADLKYPILVDEKNIILDGIHRLCKAVIEGREDIAVQRIVTMPEPFFSNGIDDVPLFV